MYSRKEIPESFHRKSAVSIPAKEENPLPIETKEKKNVSPAANSISPLAVLLLLDLFSNKKGDE